MKIHDFAKVELLITQMREIMYARERVEMSEPGNSMLGVTINGTYQNSDMVKCVKPVVIEELTRRIEAIKVQLMAYGVEFSEKD